jgi:hypothetical protein
LRERLSSRAHADIDDVAMAALASLSRNACG